MQTKAQACSQEASTKEASTQEGVSQPWPQSSDSACWHCCHTFTTVPCYLPIAYDRTGTNFLFSGCFCSWNCVKSYAVDKAKQRHKAEGFEYISLFAFLLVHRPMNCYRCPTQPHPESCDCLREKFSVMCAPPKEVLKMFGGNMDIEEYRKDFLCIRDKKWVIRYFNDRTDISSTLQSLSSTPVRRMWIFHNYDSFELKDKVTEEKQPEEKITPPVVKIKRKPKLYY